MHDCFGFEVMLTVERQAHILQHPEMAGLEEAIPDTLVSPKEVRLSRSDQSIRLFYQYYENTPVDAKWLCVVVKYLEANALVVTAYLTDKLKTGDSLWPKK